MSEKSKKSEKSEKSEKIDPVQVEIIRNAFVAAAEEMSITVWRTSRSSIVRENLDYSTSVFDGRGLSVAQSARMPVHLNSMASCLTDILDHHIPLELWNEGDIIVTNDPYSGGQHLPDIQTFMPVYEQGERVAIAGILVHHLDVGGGAPGSFDPSATEIYQEGFRIPPLHLQRQGVRNHEVEMLLLRNTREPEKVGGDLQSQLAALEVGASNLRRIAQRYGPDVMSRACEQIQDQSELAMRDAIGAIPNGNYTFEDFVDGDGIEDGHIRVHVALEVRDDEMVVDLTESAAQTKGPINCTRNMTNSAVFCGIMMAIDDDIPANAGCYRPITIRSQPGTVVDAQSPAPVANRMAVGHRVVNATMGAMSRALPGKVAAAYYGVSFVYSVGFENEDGSRQVYFDISCGGWGAHPNADGANGFSCGFHNIANGPVEMIELDYPITFTEYALCEDSGGRGRKRGGLGLKRSFKINSPKATFTANLDRFECPPYGLDGGEPGGPASLSIRRVDDSVQALKAKTGGLSLVCGDEIRLITAGGGGYGDPSERDSTDLERDRIDRYDSR